MIPSDFAVYNLDFRILQAMKDMEWSTPTDIQKEAIPLALNGSHLLLRSRTGTGKTAIYLISIIDKLLEKNLRDIKAIIFAPSVELCQQISESLRNLIKFIPKIKFFVATSDSFKPRNFDDYHIVIGTPTRCLELLKHYDHNDMFKIVVFDEADLLFTYGHRSSLDAISSLLPTRMQVFILSATLTEEVEKLSVVHLINPKRIVISDEPLPDSNQLTQYLIKSEDSEKYLILYSLLVLKLISGKTLIFCNSITNSYKLFLFLKFFSISSLVLNSELPLNTRIKTVQKFVKNKSNILISTDLNEETSKLDDASISRGMDFSKLDNVINFDFPPSITSYIHRVGRTARMDSIGIALTFYTSENLEMLESLQNFVKENSNAVLVPFKFKMETVEGFRYRTEDALKSITKSAIATARRDEIKDEIYNSEKIKEYFKTKPREKMILKSSKSHKRIQYFEHLKKLPEYLVPESLKDNFKCEMDNTGYFNIDHKKIFLKKKFGRNHQSDPLRQSKAKRKPQDI